MRRFFVALAISSIGVNVAFAQDRPVLGLDDLVPKTLQAQMGLQKLTSREREKIRTLLVDTYLRGVEEGKRLSAALTPGSNSRCDVESSVDGEFEGWEGDTVIRLMNGQIWEQSEYYYEYSYSYMPRVTIFQSRGQCKMLVDGTDEPVGVRQIR